ncbi:MAG TPA: BrnT family toxin [Gammaproteobacteria bacterium]|nr:BrnT family toxin [Gammaproteobacteria bacterium]
MRFDWDGSKNETNIQRHGIDFHDAHLIFKEPILIRVDTRKNYNEVRLIGLGKLFGVNVVIIFTKRVNTIRVISIRRANRNERKIYQERFQ